MNLSDILKNARGEHSFREMERRTGLSHIYLIQLEKGLDPRNNKVRQPSLDTLKTLSDTLHIDFATLLASVGFSQMLDVQEENKRLREALEYYADEKHYEPYSFNSYGCDVTEDGGMIARLALGGE